VLGGGSRDTADPLRIGAASAFRVALEEVALEDPVILHDENLGTL
jgi:hypothetical protein